MTWFKVDDSLAFHAKVVQAGNAAMGLWVRAGAYCSQHLTDGFVSREVALTLGKSSEVKRLVAAGLWEEIDDGYQVHDWLEYNPTAEEVRAEQARKHEAKARAGRAGGIASGVARRKHERSTVEADAKQSESETEAKRSPVPSRTASKEAVARKRASQAPDSIEITDAMRQWATEKAVGVDLDRETERFLDHHRAKGSAFKDWTAAWRTWMSRAQGYGNVHSIRPDGARKQQVHVGGDRWRDVTGDEVVFGRKTRWVPA